eukprot:GGOE01060722.1.p2 GENE.GGOE01060722.1~~GGOE01060722.1.p2  ORF type:complete len:162 (+),score=42.65 GGOE01060722.1:35-520(+)
MDRRKEPELERHGSDLSLDLCHDFEVEEERRIGQLLDELEVRLARCPVEPLPPSDSTQLNEFNPYRPRGEAFRKLLRDTQFEEWCHVPHLLVRGRSAARPPKCEEDAALDSHEEEVFASDGTVEDNDQRNVPPLFSEALTRLMGGNHHCYPTLQQRRTGRR